MGKNNRVTIQRLKQILSRQEPSRYGAAYVPATFATKEEAPSLSRPAILQSLIPNREVHVFSQPERHAALLALYHPRLVDLHEQKMLQRWPALHPLADFPDVDATLLPTLRGTIDVADRLGYLDLLPVVYVQDPDGSRRKVPVPFPYLGDLLLILRGSDSATPYCINWPIKDTRDAFTAPAPTKHCPNERDRRKAHARYVIEVEYYADAHIRTQPVANSDIDRNVAANLVALFTFTTSAISAIAQERRKEIVDAYRAAIVMEIPPMEIIGNLELRGRCSAWDATVILNQAIWNRELHVNLFKPLLVDYPLEPEVIDVIQHYAEWFKP